MTSTARGWRRRRRPEARSDLTRCYYDLMPSLSAPMLRGGPFDNVPSIVTTTVAIQAKADDTPRKVTKIVGYREGGLGLLAPYHSARSGVLTKTLVDYSAGGRRVAGEDMELFSAGDRVKLSYHPDGFVQFSGERSGRIVSGKDPRSGEPRGLGIMANPMDAPVMTGPSFGISAWGLEDFLVQEGRPRGDLLVFEQDDFVYDHCDVNTWGSYGIEFFIFTMYFQPFVRQVGRTRFELPLWHNQFHSIGRSFNFKVVRLGQQPYFLGAICLRRPALGPDAKSGWAIGSPGALSRGAIKPVLHAHYPADGWPSPEESLDYTRPTPDRDQTGRPVFARDYDALIKRADARLTHLADRDLPDLALVSEGIRLLAQVVESTILMPGDLENSAGSVRIALTTLGLLGLRGARAAVLVLEPGYVPEAGVVLTRLTSAVELAHLVTEDSDGTVAERFLEGAGLDELDPVGWASIAESIAANLEQLPPLSLVQTPLGPRPGLGFSGSRQLPEARELALELAFLLGDMALTCGKVLFGGMAPDLFAKRLISLRAEVASRMQPAEEANSDPSAPGNDSD